MVENKEYVAATKFYPGVEQPIGWVYADELMDYRYGDRGWPDHGYEAFVDTFGRKMAVTSGNLRKCPDRQIYLSTVIEPWIPEKIYPEVLDRVKKAREAEREAKKAAGVVYHPDSDGFRVAQQVLADYLEEAARESLARAR